MAQFKPVWYTGHAEDRLAARGIARELVEEILHAGGDRDYPGPLGFVWREKRMGEATVAVLYREFPEFYQVHDAHRE